MWAGLWIELDSDSGSDSSKIIIEIIAVMRIARVARGRITVVRCIQIFLETKISSLRAWILGVHATIAPVEHCVELSWFVFSAGLIQEVYL